VSAPEFPKFPVSLQANPRLGRWLVIHANGNVTVRSGKVDLGQGISRALSQIVADGLGVEVSRIHMAPANTACSPNEGVTSGSLSVQDSGSALRLVCAQARAIYLQAAAKALGITETDPANVKVLDGQINFASSPRSTSYWELAHDTLLDVDVVALPNRQAPHAHFVGQSLARKDIERKVRGAPSFIHDLRLPGMLHGRVVHPPSTQASLTRVDLDQVHTRPGVVSVVREGNFLGVVAGCEFQAVQAATKLAAAASWQETARLPDHNALGHFLRQQPLETTLVGEKARALPLAPAPETQQLSARYSRPFLAHASIGPACALAMFTPGGSATSPGSVQEDSLEIWSHTQGIFNLRADLALVMNMPAPCITVYHCEGAGCYGHNGADDVAADAALLARSVPGQPVRVVWSREDELGVAPFGPAMAVELQAEWGADGLIVDWQHQVWSNGHGLRPGRGTAPVLLAGTLLEKPFERQVSVNAPLAAGGGAERNAVPLYDFVQWKATSHRLLTMPVRSSALRSLGGHGNVFAAESFMDEIASAAGACPLAFRLRHLTDARAREVLQTAAQNAAWAQRKDAKAEGHGFGLAVTRYKNTGAYCAVVARVDASRDLKVTDLWIAVDVGLVINPDGVANQIEGGAIQTVSWVLKEAVQFDATRITSTTWETYPILKFSEVPRVAVHIINQPDQPSVGAGEATHGPVAAAIANALFDATGVRVRDMPFTPERLRQAALAQ
jgi:nicotinate dehydrogenase subunit B